MTDETARNELDIDALREQCQSGDADTQIEAMRTLMEAGAQEAVAVILPLLASDDDHVRETAVHALSRLGSQHLARVGPALEAALSDPEWLVRNAAVEAIGFLRHAPARAALERVLRSDSQWEVRASAAEALGELGDPQALDALAAALDDEPFPIRSYAAFAIGQLGDASQLSVIRRRLAVEEHFGPRANLVAAALRFGDEAALEELRALVQCADDEDSVYRVLCAIEDLLVEPPSVSIVVDRAAEIDAQLAALGQRADTYDDWATELRQRLGALAGAAAGEK